MNEREFEPIVLRGGPADSLHLTGRTDWVEVQAPETMHMYRRTDEIESDERGYEYRIFRYIDEDANIT